MDSYLRGTWRSRQERQPPLENAGLGAQMTARRVCMGRKGEETDGKNEPFCRSRTSILCPGLTPGQWVAPQAPGVSGGVTERVMGARIGTD